MRLTEAEVQDFHRSGYLFLHQRFSLPEMDAVLREIPAEFARDAPSRVMEKDGTTVRSVYGSHKENSVFGRLARDRRLVECARQVLGTEVYIHQFKVNAKAAFGGDIWEWHQDFIFWLKEDGMPKPEVVNAVVYLDEVTEFNGPIVLIPGSHGEATIDCEPDEAAAQLQPGGSRVSPPGTAAAYEDKPSWITNLVADLKYSLDRETVGRLVTRYGMVAPKGPRGSVLLFHCNTAHASSPNLSPFDRRVVIVSFNSVNNLPVPTGLRRPDFLASRDFEPVIPAEDGAILET